MPVSSPYGPSACAHPYPAVAFFGQPIFRQPFGGESLICIATEASIGSVRVVPLTVVLSR